MGREIGEEDIIFSGLLVVGGVPNLTLAWPILFLVGVSASGLASTWSVRVALLRQ